MSAPDPCPTDPVVLAFLEGELSDPDRVTVATHLGTCGECCDRAIEYRALEEGVRSLSSADAVRWHAFESPFGPTFVAVTERGLARLSWTGDHDAESFRRELEERFAGRPVVRDGDSLDAVERELDEYFSGRRSTFEIPVDLTVLSDFERRVLGTLREEVHYGEVIPYAELARRIGRPRAARAVGNALGRNPIAIVVPCHRVIRSDGSLGGYSGGLEFKRRLLAVEGREDLLRTG